MSAKAPTTWRARLRDLGGRFQVGIVVRDPDRMVDFYEGLLGFTYVENVQVPGVLIKRFVLGDAGLKLLVLDEGAAQPNVPGAPTGGVAGIRDLTIAVDDVSETVERCLEARSRNRGPAGMTRARRCRRQPTMHSPKSQLGRGRREREDT